MQTFSLNRYVHKFWPLWMLAVVAVMTVPYWVMQGGSYFAISDNLDSNAVWYAIAGRYWGQSGSTPVPELMNGVALSSIWSTDLIFQAAYHFLSPLHAYLTLYTVNVAVAFAGMYGLVLQLAGREHAVEALLAATLFAALPCIPIYADSVLGTALVACALVALWKGDTKQKRLGLWYGCVLYYGFTASLFFVGYAVLCVSALAFLLAAARKRLAGKKHFVWANIILCAAFLVQNRSMLAHFLGVGTTEVSHRSEFRLQGVPKEELFAEAKDLFLNGQYHAPSCHRAVLWVSLAVLAAAFLFYKVLSKETKRLLWSGVSLLGANVGIAGFYAVFHSGPVTRLRSLLGGIGSFQFDRFYILSPTLWYALLGVSLALLCSMLLQLPLSRARLKKAAALLLVLGAAGICLRYESAFMGYYRETLAAAKGTPMTTQDITWNQFYDQELFAEIAADIGQPQSTYKVGSIGIHPSVALMNGFYCVDGYCADYPLTYKHAFREIIAGELYRSKVLQDYFDGWGSRCYLYIAETGNCLSFKTTEPRTIQEMWLNLDAFQALGGRYLLSAVEIGNAQELGLRCRGVYTREDSVWEIYLYEVS